MDAVLLLFVLLALTAGLLLAAYAIVLLRRGIRTAGESDGPAWPRFHVRFYTFALLFTCSWRSPHSTARTSRCRRSSSTPSRTSP
jgi:hypothetical protein